MRKVVLILLLFALTEGFCFCQSRFFRQYWAEYKNEINNTNSTGRPERPRVGDRGMSTHPDYWSRTETQVNGEGEVKEPFKLNGMIYKITSGNAVNDLVYTINKVDTGTLKQGLNEIQLLSDTEHHGIEVCWPGPALIVKFKSPVK